MELRGKHWGHNVMTAEEHLANCAQLAELIQHDQAQGVSTADAEWELECAVNALLWAVAYGRW